MIARSLFSVQCKNLNVAHYSKSIKDINTKLGILAHHDKVQLQDKGHNSESYSFKVMSLFYQTILSRNDGPLQMSVIMVSHAVLFP